MAEAIADANAALAITAVAYNARYLMGVAKLKTGDTAGSNVSIATAKALAPVQRITVLVAFRPLCPSGPARRQS